MLWPLLLLAVAPECRVVVPPPAAPDAAYPTEDTNTQRRVTPQVAGGVCEVADSNLALSTKAILARPNVAPKSPSAPWNHRAPLKYLDLVTRRFPLTQAERTLLDTQGFVVSPRIAYPSYAWAFHDVFQSQLPVYVSADAIFHAVFKANDGMVEAVEAGRLMPLTAGVLEAMACALPEAARDYPPDVAKDVDLYLAVARTLLSGLQVKSALGVDAHVDELTAAAIQASRLETVTLFGRQRTIDWTAYTPRGHYAKVDPEAPITHYFRAAMWLSRLEFNLASRGCASSTVEASQAETPREVMVAMALADLARRAHALEALAQLDDAWTVLAGRREDVSVADLLRLHPGPVTADAPAQLRAAIGTGFARTARLHPLPQGCEGELAAISTLLGPRVVPDARAARALVNPDVPERSLLGAGDVAFLLGHERGKQLLAADLKQFPALGPQLEVGRKAMTLDAGDLYSAWLAAVRAVAVKPDGTQPSFAATDAFADLRVNTALAAYGQLKHNSVLVAGQSYDEGGCEIPDGYVEAVPAVYEALLQYAQRGDQLAGRLDPGDGTGAHAYFARLAQVLTVLNTIAKDELAGRPLSVEERRFLAMPVELVSAQTGREPTYTGWYFDLFRDRVGEGLASAHFIAAHFTSASTQRVAYLGARGPELGFFVVDTNGPPRVMVGPVARAYEYVGPLATRVDDEGSLRLADVQAPWATSYRPAAPPPPPLAFKGVGTPEGTPYEGVTPSPAFAVRSSKPLGKVTFELLGHHGLPFATVTTVVGPTTTKFRFPMKHVRKGSEPQIEWLRVRVGEAWWALQYGVMEEPDYTNVAWGGVEPFPEDFK